MTVAELIDKLSRIRDQELPVVLTEWSIGDPLAVKCEVTTNRIVIHPHRVSILTD